MLVKLMPDQIARYWDFFKDAIDKTLPPITRESPNRMNKILEMLLAGGLVCWLSVKKEGETVATGFVITQIIGDYVGETKSLLLYSLYTEGGFAFQEYIEGHEALSKYAKANGCTSIVGYSNHKAVLKRAEQFGADISYRLIQVPIK